MPIPAPNLDDRTYDQLVQECLTRIAASCPSWTDLGPSDPGMVVLELFAYLTSTMLYRLNRIPEKAYVSFLDLIGVRLLPPEAARVNLVFERRRPDDRPVEIPRGTRVSASRTAGGREPPVFVTAGALVIPAGQSEAGVLAFHCQQVDAELAGLGTGMVAQIVVARQPPIVGPTGDGLDLVVGVQVQEGEIDQRARAVRHDGKTYRVWREVENFANLGDDRFAYVCDRVAGTITFAPAVRRPLDSGGLADAPEALAEVPQLGSEIRLWYRSGGGAEGNVAAGTLTVLKDPIPGVDVRNPEPATGGRPADTVGDAIVRGPQEFHSLHRVVTARDFQLAAVRSSGAVARARALTSADLWRHAVPGSVDVLLVPYVAEDERTHGGLTPDVLRSHETAEALDHVYRALAERKPLATSVRVRWTSYKQVTVKGRIVLHREEDRESVLRRVLERLHGTVNPLPTLHGRSGWPFGEALRASHVYDILLAEPGVRYADRVRLEVGEVPARDVGAVVADRFQPKTWYAASGPVLFRSLNDGEGWEPAGRFEGERIEGVWPHRSREGLVAVVVRLGANAGSTLHLSWDCGETWEQVTSTTFVIEDAAWTMRGGAPVLFLATDRGLYEITPGPGAGPIQVLVDRKDQDRGFYAVVATTDVQGITSVAAAAQTPGGVFLSSNAGAAGSFRMIGLLGEDVRTLAVQRTGPRSVLWAGTAATGTEDPGKGCFTWELRGNEDPPEGWWPRSERWQGGSCWSLAFHGDRVFAASHRAGVLRMDPTGAQPQWLVPDVRCGLPLKSRGIFQPVLSVAANPEQRLLLAGGPEGVFLSANDGDSYALSSGREFTERVTLPPTWLFCSGDHELEAVSSVEAD